MRKNLLMIWGGRAMNSGGKAGPDESDFAEEACAVDSWQVVLRRGPSVRALR